MLFLRNTLKLKIDTLFGWVFTVSVILWWKGQEGFHLPPSPTIVDIDPRVLCMLNGHFQHSATPSVLFQNMRHIPKNLLPLNLAFFFLTSCISFLSFFLSIKLFIIFEIINTILETCLSVRITQFSVYMTVPVFS